MGLELEEATLAMEQVFGVTAALRTGPWSTSSLKPKAKAESDAIQETRTWLDALAFNIPAVNLVKGLWIFHFVLIATNRSLIMKCAQTGVRSPDKHCLLRNCDEELFRHHLYSFTLSVRLTDVDTNVATPDQGKPCTKASDGIRIKRACS